MFNAFVVLKQASCRCIYYLHTNIFSKTGHDYNMSGIINVLHATALVNASTLLGCFLLS